MLRALGIIEFSSIARGIEVADKMVKAASVEVVALRHICPGKFMIILGGDLEDVRESLEATLENDKNKVVESVLISNPHEDLVISLKKRPERSNIEAIGVFETSTVASSLVALDMALKSASVGVIKLVVGNGIGGKSYFVITGQVSSVEEAIKIAASSINQRRLVHSTIIPSPNEDIINNL